MRVNRLTLLPIKLKPETYLSWEGGKKKKRKRDGGRSKIRLVALGVEDGVGCSESFLQSEELANQEKYEHR